MNTKKTLIEAAFLGLILFIAVVILGRGFGPYWDSWFYYDQASRWGAWFASWWVGAEARSLLSEPQWYFPY